ncbi:hypothetical protein [uncultured Muribaculum sp.]|uniref:hypothetical protein n=1 Tax=uncultured Muribaculum sp. TaxID=1918613 RepID=UPI0026775E1A|nr:hypothetical protein [uncultured Muribaculum sp.]
MNKQKFEYFLNAIHYGFWLKERTFNKGVRKIVDILFYPIPKLLLTKNMKKRYYENTEKSQPQINDFFYNKKKGLCIRLAHHNFGAFYSIYTCILPFVLEALYIKFNGEINSFVILIIFAIPAGICYIPAYKAVFSNDKYLQYFKQFEKEDEHWHKKWKRITTAFILGAIASIIFGVYLCFTILDVKVQFPWM